jgi:hypothetical protein
MIEPKSIVDCELKHVFNQEPTFLGAFQTLGKRDVRCLDSYAINPKKHIMTSLTALSDPFLFQEFIVIGMSKGVIVLVHVRQPDKVFLRVTLHR